MDTKGLQKEFINWCKSKNKQPKSEDETKQLFVAFMKEKHPEEYKAAMENQQKQAQKALHGAKLNYFRTLKNQCAEDEEVVYYKKGGSVNCGCKKKEEGGEVRKAGLGCPAVERFKSIKKAGFGDVLIKIANSLSGGGFKKAEEEKTKRTISSVKKGPGTTKQPTIDGTKKMQEENKKKFKNDYSSKRVKDSEEDYLKGKTNEAAAEKCGGKVKKHQEGSVIAKFKAYRKGGSLNGISFYQGGTPEGGINIIKRGINGEYYYNPIPYAASNRTGTNPFMDILTTNISNNPYLITGAPDFLPGMAGGNIGKVVGQIRKLPIGKRGAVRTINGKKVNILDKKVEWAKDADIRKSLDPEFNSKWAGRIDYSK